MEEPTYRFEEEPGDTGWEVEDEEGDNEGVEDVGEEGAEEDVEDGEYNVQGGYEEGECRPQNGQGVWMSVWSGLWWGGNCSVHRCQGWCSSSSRRITASKGSPVRIGQRTSGRGGRRAPTVRPECARYGSSRRLPTGGSIFISPRGGRTVEGLLYLLLVFPFCLRSGGESLLGGRCRGMEGTGWKSNTVDVGHEIDALTCMRSLVIDLGKG